MHSYTPIEIFMFEIHIQYILLNLRIARFSIKFFNNIHDSKNESSKKLYWNHSRKVFLVSSLSQDMNDFVFLCDCNFTNDIEFTFSIPTTRKLFEYVQSISFISTSKNSYILQAKLHNDPSLSTFIYKHMMLRDYSTFYELYYEPETISPQNFYCRNCKSTQIISSLTVKRLPSRHWQDLVDCWSCHNCQHDEYHHKFASHDVSITCPSPDIAYSSTEEWVILASMTKVFESNNLLKCSECESILGIIEQESECLVSKFSKYQIMTMYDDPDPNGLILLSRQLSDRIHSDACYHFNIITKEESKVLSLWIINPEVYVSITKDNDILFAKAMQVAFKVSEMQNKIDSDDAIYLPKDRFEMCISILEHLSQECDLEMLIDYKLVLLKY